MSDNLTGLQLLQIKLAQVAMIELKDNFEARGLRLQAIASHAPYRAPRKARE